MTELLIAAWAVVGGRGWSCRIVAVAAFSVEGRPWHHPCPVARLLSPASDSSSPSFRNQINMANRLLTASNHLQPSTSQLLHSLRCRIHSHSSLAATSSRGTLPYPALSYRGKKYLGVPKLGSDTGPCPSHFIFPHVCGIAQYRGIHPFESSYFLLVNAPATGPLELSIYWNSNREADRNVSAPFNTWSADCRPPTCCPGRCYLWMNYRGYTELLSTIPLRLLSSSNKSEPSGYSETCKQQCGNRSSSDQHVLVRSTLAIP